MATHHIPISSLPASVSAARFDGAAYDSQVSFFVSRNLPGTGPDLHTHPYEETFIVLEGQVTFTVGEATVVASAGEVVVAPKDTPHGFVNTGDVALLQIGIHPVARMETTWL
jgi:quercetin dioxygenase-like cupin family protein